MNNASSALAAAGNTFEQSVALLTAANTTNAGMVATNISGSGMGKVLSVAFGEITLSATAAQLAVGAFVAVLGIALAAYSSYKRSVEETRQRNIDAANAAGDMTDELSDLTSQYIELSEAVKTNGDEKENVNAKMQSEMLEIQKEIDSLEGHNTALVKNSDSFRVKNAGCTGAA